MQMCVKFMRDIKYMHIEVVAYVPIKMSNENLLEKNTK